MAFVVPVKNGRFELRESRSTPKGPRSRTLASFSELDEAVIAQAQKRSAKQLSGDDLRRSARRAGAPVARKPIDRAARQLIAELAKGRRLDPGLRRILLDLLRDGYRDGPEPSPSNEAAHEVAEWMAATTEQRGKALVDLLLLGDALPHGGRKEKPLRFPRLDSTSR